MTGTIPAQVRFHLSFYLGSLAEYAEKARAADPAMLPAFDPFNLSKADDEATRMWEKVVDRARSVVAYYDALKVADFVAGDGTGTLSTMVDTGRMIGSIPERLDAQFIEYLDDLRAAITSAERGSGETAVRWRAAMRAAQYALAGFNALRCTYQMDPDMPDPFVLFGVGDTDPA